jgi:adenylate kinase
VVEVSRVIVITGTPGVGKTATAKALTSRLNASYIGINELVRDENLVAHLDEDRGTLVADITRLAERVNELLDRADRDQVIDGHYAHDVVHVDRATHVFVLRRHPGELRTILAKRGYREDKILENLNSEILDVCLTEALERHGVGRVGEIDTSSVTVEETVESMLSVIDGGRELTVGKIDWLGQLEAAGRLEEYFR